MDSSRLLAALLSLVRDSDIPSGEVQGVIAIPILRRLLSAIHFRDANTLKHSRRVGLISVGIATRLGWEESELRIAEIAALLHDVGKIGIPDHILRKPGKLSPDEAEYIAVHHRVAVALLQAFQVHPRVTEIIAQSHGVAEEYINGKNPLVLGARILAVADAYDSLTTRQCYRAPYDRWEALQILEEQAGKQFDRNVVAALGRWLDGPDAGALADERAAEVSIQVNAPVDMETRLNATQLCQIFNHLYLLESLYDAFYVVDAKRKIIIWNSGAAELFHRPAQEVLQKKWNRKLVAKTPANTDPLEAVLIAGQPVCHGMTIQDAEGTYVDVDVQSTPILLEDGKVAGVVELVCNGRESKRHRGQFRTLQMAATRDPLTGVMNRGELERQLSETYELWSNQQCSPFSVVFMDLDHFKSINDRISHGVGDRVLIECGRLLQDELYSGELIGRYGGEEFVVLCPETDLQAAVERAERLRRAIMSARFADRDDLRVTASFGVAQVQPGDTTTSVMDRADHALYDAKRQGRNRTCFSQLAPDAGAPGKERRKSSSDLTHSATISTHVAVEMLVLKLTGFVEENAAKLLNVEPRQVVMQVGSSGLFSGWGRAAGERLPVQVTMDISDAPREPESTGKRLLLKTTVVPLTRHVDATVFRARANHVIEQLRSHLIA